jgi:hypothetical protein
MGVGGVGVGAGLGGMGDSPGADALSDGASGQRL